MRRRSLAALIALVGCGSSSDPPPAPKPAPPSRPSLLDEAARLAAKPDELVALARAYVARKDPAKARAVLARIADRDGDLATRIGALDVRALLGDDVAKELDATVMMTAMAMEPPRHAFAIALGEAESPAALAAVAGGLAIERDFFEDLEGAELSGTLVPGQPRWDAVLAAIRGLDPTLRGAKLLGLARIARHRQAPVAHALAIEAAALPLPAGTARLVAIELALEGDRAAATKVRVPPVPPPAGEQGRAEQLAAQAELAALLGDAAGSRAAARKASAIAAGIVDDLRGGTAIGLAGDGLWTDLALAAYARGDLADAREPIAQMSPLAIAELVEVLPERGLRDEALRLASGLRGNDRELALRYVVIAELERGDLAAAGMVSRSVTMADKDHPGFDELIRATALAGDLPHLAELLRDNRAPLATITREAMLDLAARSLARRGTCDRAVELARDVKLQPATCLATVARYCP